MKFFQGIRFCRLVGKQFESNNFSTTCYSSSGNFSRHICASRNLQRHARSNISASLILEILRCPPKFLAVTCGTTFFFFLPFSVLTASLTGSSSTKTNGFSHFQSPPSDWWCDTPILTLVFGSNAPSTVCFSAQYVHCLSIMFNAYDKNNILFIVMSLYDINDSFKCSTGATWKKGNMEKRSIYDIHSFTVNAVLAQNE